MSRAAVACVSKHRVGVGRFRKDGQHEAPLFPADCRAWNEIKALTLSWFVGLALVLSQIEALGRWLQGPLDAYIAMILKSGGDCTPRGQLWNSTWPQGGRRRRGQQAMWRWPKPSPRSACRTRWMSSMKSWILSMSPSLRSWKEIVEVAQISPERDQEAHRLRSATRVRSRNASRRREWISRCLRTCRKSRRRYSERKVACPYHTHTLHCERALRRFCGYTKHTPFQVMSPSTIQQFAEIY